MIRCKKFDGSFRIIVCLGIIIILGMAVVFVVHAIKNSRVKDFWRDETYGLERTTRTATYKQLLTWGAQGQVRNTGGTGGTSSFAGTITLSALGGNGATTGGFGGVTPGSGGSGGTHTNGFSLPGFAGSAIESIGSELAPSGYTGGAAGMTAGQYGQGGESGTAGNNGLVIVYY